MHSELNQQIKNTFWITVYLYVGLPTLQHLLILENWLITVFLKILFIFLLLLPKEDANNNKKCRLSASNLHILPYCFLKDLELS